MRVAIAVAIGIALSSLGCHRSPPATVASTDAPRMDSATIERLCVSPDSVRAGTAACVLKDQARIRVYGPPRTP